jgi:hypothetical protein
MRIRCCIYLKNNPYTEDLSKHIRSSMEGLRVAQGANAAPEPLSPAKLAPKANRLYHRGQSGLFDHFVRLFLYGPKRF